MSKKTKKILGIIIAILLVIGVIWLLNSYAKPQTTSIEPVNEQHNENMGVSNEIINVVEQEETNIINETKEEIVNEEPDSTAKEEVKENNEKDEEDSEVVSGTSASREEQAVELAKKYYEKEYGSAEGVYFTYTDIYKDGRYIVTVGNADGGSNSFLYVNIKTGEVSDQR